MDRAIDPDSKGNLARVDRLLGFGKIGVADFPALSKFAIKKWWAWKGLQNLYCPEWKASFPLIRGQLLPIGNGLKKPMVAGRWVVL
jgi:hypothetical protein